MGPGDRGSEWDGEVGGDFESEEVGCGGGGVS